MLETSNYRVASLNIKWNELPEVKEYLKQEMLPDTHPLTWRELWVVDMGAVLKTHFIEKDPDCTLFGYLLKMATTSQGSIGALLSASFCERINSCANQVLTSGNSSLGPALIDKIVVLRMNKKFMKFMRRSYPGVLNQKFPSFGTVVSVADNEQDPLDAVDCDSE